MEEVLKMDNYYYGIKLSELSLQNAAKWRKQELLNLTKLSMIQIDNFSMYDPNSDLIKIRLFSLKKILLSISKTLFLLFKCFVELSILHLK